MASKISSFCVYLLDQKISGKIDQKELDRQLDAAFGVQPSLKFDNKTTQKVKG